MASCYKSKGSWWLSYSSGFGNAGIAFVRRRIHILAQCNAQWHCDPFACSEEGEATEHRFADADEKLAAFVELNPRFALAANCLTG
jgi:hypothetical protein